jgi:hypothetical protein
MLGVGHIGGYPGIAAAPDVMQAQLETGRRRRVRPGDGRERRSQEKRLP